MADGSKLKDLFAPIVASLALVAFVVFLVFMFKLIFIEEDYWSRAIYLLTGIESIALAAAGFFFGSEVRRKEAESAREDAGSARRDAKKAREESDEAKTQVKGILLDIETKREEFKKEIEKKEAEKEIFTKEDTIRITEDYLNDIIKRTLDRI